MYENEAVQDLFKSMARVADYFNWDLSRREDPDDAEEVWPSAEVMLHEMEQETSWSPPTRSREEAERRWAAVEHMDKLNKESDAMWSTVEKAGRWGFWHRYPS